MIEFPDGRKYIGYTTAALEQRVMWHIKASSSKTYGTRLHLAMRRHGYRFICTVLRECQTKDEALATEVDMIRTHRSADAKHGVNMTPGGESPPEGFGGMAWTNGKTPEEIALINSKKGRSGESNPFYGARHRLESLQQAAKTRRSKGSYGARCAKHLNSSEMKARLALHWASAAGDKSKGKTSIGVRDASARRRGYANDAQLTEAILAVEEDCFFSCSEISRRLNLTNDIVLPRMSKMITQRERFQMKKLREQEADKCLQ